MDRRDFVRSTAAGIALVSTPTQAGAAPIGAPFVAGGGWRVARAVCVADVSAIQSTNGGPESAIARAFCGITEGEDVLDALVAGANIPDLDPEETGIG